MNANLPTETTSVVTRIAPSPTGQMHIGTVRTALFNYLFAKKHGGTYFVRIEDTDRERNREEWVEAIWDDFAWCGLIPDARYRTSELLARHQELLHMLVEKDLAYISKEPKKDDPNSTVEVVRLRNKGTSVTFDDLIRGTVTFDTTELGDFVIARSIDDPLYHFAVVVDDGDAGVTHILRAEEHISNTPRQILIQEALGFSRPQYGHLPLILAPDRSKLSKRKHGASIDNYRAMGILPNALINYLAMLGWNPGTEQEIFSLEALIEQFDLSGIQKGGAIFDIEKLRWFNKEYIKMQTAQQKKEMLHNACKEMSIWQQFFDDHEGVRDDVLERHATTGEVVDAIGKGEYDFYLRTPEVSKDLLVPQKATDSLQIKAHVDYIVRHLRDLSEGEFTKEAIKTTIWEYASDAGRGMVLWPMRTALSGMRASPDPFLIAEAIGKQETLARLERAAQILSG